MTLADFQQLIVDYGYLAIFVGTFLEGETILVVGGLLAQRGYLSLPLVMLTAFVGSLAGDQLAFFLGRFKGRAIVRRWPRLADRIDQAERLIYRHRYPVILGFRFLYGLRNVIPIALGLMSVPVSEFAMLNMVGAAIWAVAVAWGGYAFGAALAGILDHIKQYEAHAVLGLFLLGGVVFVGVRIYNRIKRRREPPAP